MTTEERLTQVETLLETQSRDITDIKNDLKALTEVANMGKGMLWFVIRLGMFIIGASGFAKLMWDTFGGRH